jgi:hypothetical protein
VIWAIDKELSGGFAGGEDIVVGVPDENAELVGAQIAV